MKILVIDDHPLYRKGVVQALHDQIADAEVVECGSMAAALEQLTAAAPPDLILLDLQMPGSSGLDTLRAVRAARAEVPVLVLSAVEDTAVVRQCVDLGAWGFVPKSAGADMLARALELVRAGGVFLPPSSLSVGEHAAMSHQDAWSRLGARLTDRQREVLLRIVQGKPNKVIARELQLSDGTIKTHVSNIFNALAVSNRTEAVYALARAGVGIQHLAAPPSPAVGTTRPA